MASSIDATKPVSGSPTTSSVRSNFSAAESEINALQIIVPVAFGKVISDGSGAQDVSDCVGVTSCTIDGTVFDYVLTSAVASTTSMVVTVTSNYGVSVFIAAATQTSTTEFSVVCVTEATGLASVAAATEMNFIVMDAG